MYKIITSYRMKIPISMNRLSMPIIYVSFMRDDKVNIKMLTNADINKSQYQQIQMSMQRVRLRVDITVHKNYI